MGKKKKTNSPIVAVVVVVNVVVRVAPQSVGLGYTKVIMGEAKRLTQWTVMMVLHPPDGVTRSSLLW